MAPKIQWPLVLFSLLAGVGGCAFAFAGVANFLGESSTVTAAATVASLVFICVGGICSVVHLATPKNAWAVITHILSFSGISVELIMLGVVSALAVAFLACDFVTVPGVVKTACGLLGVFAGVYLAFATGHGYLISSKPTWNTMKLPVAYTGTSLVGGAMLYLGVSCIFGAAPSITNLLVAGALLCCLFNVVALVAYTGHLGPKTAKANKELYRYGIVGCGMVLSLASSCVMYAMCLFGIVPGALFLIVAFAGLAFALVGGLALRMLMWIVGAGFLSLFDVARERRSVILNQ